MKINLSNTIRITGKISSFNFLKGIKKGMEIPARIVIRHGNREAVLDIGGKRIRAEFIKGVPENNQLVLRLEDKSNESFIFKLIDNTDKKGFLEKILDFTVFRQNNVEKKNIIDISNFLGKNSGGIFELNSFIFNLYTKEKKNGSEITYLLNRLLKYGISKENIQNLAFILSGLHVNHDFLSSVFLLFGFGKNYVEKWIHGNKKEIDVIVKKIIQEVDNITEGKEKDDIIRQLIEVLTFAGSSHEDAVSGEIAYLDDEDCRSISYIKNQGALLFSIDFSNLGTIEFLIKKFKSDIILSIFSDQNDVLSELEKKIDQFYSKIRNINSKISINFYNKSVIINKLVEINTYYTVNSEFDIKV